MKYESKISAYSLEQGVVISNANQSKDKEEYLIQIEIKLPLLFILFSLKTSNAEFELSLVWKDKKLKSCKQIMYSLKIGCVRSIDMEAELTFNQTSINIARAWQKA